MLSTSSKELLLLSQTDPSASFTFTTNPQRDESFTSLSPDTGTVMIKKLLVHTCTSVCVLLLGTSVDKTNGEANTKPYVSVNYFSELQMLLPTEYTA